MSDKEIKYAAVCSAGINAEYNDELLKAFYSLADECRMKILFFNSFSTLYESEKHDIGQSNIFHLINYELIDGIILLAETIKDSDVCGMIIRNARQHNLPVVAIDHYIEGCYNINYTYYGAIEKIVSHLIEDHHCTRLNFIAGMRDNSFSDERLKAYKDVLLNHGIPVEEERIGYGDFNSSKAEEVMEVFLNSSLPFPDAIVCANDTMAIAALKCLSQAGYRVPEDVAVTGYDGIAVAKEHLPKVTTARNDYLETALQAFQMIREHSGETEPKQVFVRPVIMRGDSCGCGKSDWRQRQYNYELTDKMYSRLDEYDEFGRMQIAMTADLTDNDSFQGIFDSLMKYSENFLSDKFWLCIVDDFLIQREALFDIIEESGAKNKGYSTVMDAMLQWSDGEWLGISDFPTTALLPKLSEVLAVENNVMFLPLHVLERTIGYVALVYRPERMKMIFAYQFITNVGNALETTRIHQVQQTIINNLEIKYVHDPMTGLFNRRGFYQRLETVYSRCLTEGKMLMVISVDLNGLKQINDTYGHADGDIAISTVGKALVSASDNKHTCARFGGDEFIAAGEVESEQATEQFCSDVAEYLNRYNEQSQKPYKVSASIGFITCVPSEGITLDEFIKEADERMYKDKVRYHCRRR